MQRMKSKHGMIWYFDMKCWQSQLIQMSWHVKTVMKYIRSLWKVSVKEQQQTSFMWITLKRCWKYRKCSISQKERIKFLDIMLSLNIMKRNTRSELHEICQSFFTDYLWKNASEILWQKHKYLLILVPLLFINTISGTFTLHQHHPYFNSLLLLNVFNNYLPAMIISKYTITFTEE